MILKQHQFHHHLNFQNISIKLNNSYDAHPFDKTQHLPPPFLNLDLPFDYDIPFVSIISLIGLAPHIQSITITMIFYHLYQVVSFPEF